MWWMLLWACGVEPSTKPVVEPEAEDETDVPEQPDEPPVDTPPEVTEEPSCFDQPMEIWCGHGSMTFQAISEGTEVELERGPQGWHFPISMIIRNTEPLVRLSVELFDVETAERISYAELNQNLPPLVPGEWACEAMVVNWQAKIEGGEAPTVDARGIPPVAVCGRPIDLVIRVIDPFDDTVLGTGAARFIGQPDPWSGEHCAAP